MPPPRARRRCASSKLRSSVSTRPTPFHATAFAWSRDEHLTVRLERQLAAAVAHEQQREVEPRRHEVPAAARSAERKASSPPRRRRPRGRTHAEVVARERVRAVRLERVLVARRPPRRVRPAWCRPRRARSRAWDSSGSARSSVVVELDRRAADPSASGAPRPSPAARASGPRPLPSAIGTRASPRRSSPAAGTRARAGSARADRPRRSPAAHRAARLPAPAPRPPRYFPFGS